MPEQRGPTRVELLVVTAIIAMLLACFGFLLPFDVAWRLASGWVTYPLKVAGDIRIEWNSVIVAAVATALFTGGLHLTLTRWRPWKLRQTVGIVFALLFAFLAGTSLIGIAHQLTWLATSDQPLTYPDRMDRADTRMVSRNNLKQIGLALHNYHDVFKSFTAGATYDPQGNALHSWQTILTPYYDSNDIIVRLDLTKPWTDPANREIFEREFPVYRNPRIVDHRHDANGYALSHYAGNIRVIRPGSSLSYAQMTDGTANTILAGEVGAGFKPWGDPTNLRDPALGLGVDDDRFGISEDHPTSVLLGDGSVRDVNPGIDPQLLKALATPDGGEEVLKHD